MAKLARREFARWQPIILDGFSDRGWFGMVRPSFMVPTLKVNLHECLMSYCHI